MAKKEAKPITGADLKIKHFDLARRLSQTMIQEMIKEGLSQREVSQVLNDVCKVTVLSEAVVSKEGALLVVQRFTELSSDLTCLMMRIVQGQTMDDFK